MNYIELSIENLKEISERAACNISKNESFDLIVYVARAGLPIAYYMNSVFSTKMVGIDAERKGNRFKEIVGPFISKFPHFVRNFFISIELKSNIHKKSTERHIAFHPSIHEIDCVSVKSILIVDDSVDTGNSMKKVYEEVKKVFYNAKVKSYGLNVWDKSESVFKTDYFSYRNTIILAPMSKDSKYYPVFQNLYEELSQKGYL